MTVYLLQANCANNRTLINMGTRKVVLCIISFLIIASGLSVFFNLTSQDAHLTHKYYNDKTLARIGSDLNFNYSSCPKNSIMLSSERLNAKPLHDNCPQVFIIGARKGGTTSLYHYLSKHPDFGGVNLDKGPSAGETFYLSTQYEKRPWEYYISQFPDSKMSGDSSVGNLVNCKVPERLYTSCGKAVKVIILFRNPLSRYESNFRMRVRLQTANTKPSSKISTLLTAELQSLYKSFTHRNVSTNHLSDSVNMLLCLYSPAINCIYEGMYYVHLHNWLCNFPAENILILSTEEFQTSSKRTFSQVLEFVGLNPLEDGILNTITEEKYNYGGKVEDEPDFRVLSSSDKEKLQKIYIPFNKNLFDLLKWHDVNWNDK